MPAINPKANVPGFGDRLPWGRRGGGFNLRRRHLLLFFRGPR